MRIGYLGPLEVTSGEGPVPVPGTRLRRLLLQSREQTAEKRRGRGDGDVHPPL